MTIRPLRGGQNLKPGVVMRVRDRWGVFPTDLSIGGAADLSKRQTGQQITTRQNTNRRFTAARVRLANPKLLQKFCKNFRKFLIPPHPDYPRISRPNRPSHTVPASRAICQPSA